MHFIQKKYFFIYIGLLVLLLSCGGSSKKETLPAFQTENQTELVLLWNSDLTEAEARDHLNREYPELSLLEHDRDFSLCHVDSGSFTELLYLLNADDRLLIAEPNYSMELMELPYPDDPFFDAQWAFSNSGTYPHYYGSLSIPQLSTEDIDMNILEAWEAYQPYAADTEPVIVAVVDTGVDYRHPDLADNMWVNTAEIADNGLDDDGNGYIDDIYGWDFFHDDSTVGHFLETENGVAPRPEDNDNHGTHCAGIIAAVANNATGTAGVASNVDVQIMSLKIHGGTNTAGSVANAVKAIRYAEAMGASICNMSWGTHNYSQTLELAIQDSSMLFVTAAGNDGSNNNSSPVYPASLRLPNVISVAFVDADGYLSPNSNYGLSTVDIAAPGQDIYSTLVGGYGYSSGSSMAAPHVTGLAAMLYAYRRDSYPSQIKDLIINTMRPLSSLDGFLVYPGIPDALQAVQSMDTLTPDEHAPFLSLSTTYEQDLIYVLVSAFDSGGSGLRKVKYIYGTKNAEFFQRDDNGNTLTSKQAVLTKSGFYTFYVEDYAGNHAVYNYYVEDDTSSPDLNVGYTVATDYSSYILSVSAEDAKSGIKSLKYLPGEHSAEMFLSNGISLNSATVPLTLTFPADTDAITFYALDYRGNSTVTVLRPQIVPSTFLHLSLLERTLETGSTFRLQAMLLPLNTTDSVTFLSLNDTIASVDADGLITALAPGETFVIASSASGIQRACKIVVSEPEPVPEPDVTPEPEPEVTPVPEPDVTPVPEPTPEVTPVPDLEPPVSTEAKNKRHPFTKNGMSLSFT